jgi:hypothetical protein
MDARQIAHDQSGCMDSRGLDILSVDTGVADVRISERDDLPAVARVGQDLLVTGDCGVEHHLAERMAGSTDRTAAKDRAIRERKDGFGFKREQAQLLGSAADRVSVRRPAPGAPNVPGLAR